MSPYIDIRWYWLSPELVLTGFGLAALLAAAVRSSFRAGEEGGKGSAGLRSAEWLSILGVAIAGALAVVVGVTGRQSSSGDMVHLWGGMTHDPFSAYLKAAVAISVILVMVMTAGYRRAMFHRPEMYGLLTLATLAIFLMASASELVTIFLAIEFLSLVSYVLVGYLKEDPRSSEAGIKYFLFGAVCSALMLYGMSLLYGLTGSTTLSGISRGLADMSTPGRQQLAIIAALLVLAGLGFKISMAPFHLWVPDAYEGAPTPITAFLSVASKAAGFAVAVRVLAVAFSAPALSDHWAGIVGVLAMLTMTWGNTAAIWQTNIKRMLAYSSIAQAGYIMVGIVAAGIGGVAVEPYAIPGILLYILVYLFMNLGAFAVVIAVANQDGTEEIPQYAGLSQRAPWLAALLTFFLLSLIGIPPTAGFIAKLFLFLAAIKAQSPLLLAMAIFLFVNSVISAYYYLNVARYMYLHAPEKETTLAPNKALVGALSVCAAVIFAIFLYAQPFIDLAQGSAFSSELLRGVMTWRTTW